MVFNSIDFLIFFPFVVMVYFVIPKKIRYIWLLVASYFFYMSWNPKYALLIGLSTVITYIGSLLIEKYKGSKSATIALVGSLILNLSILVFFKYANWLIGNLCAVLGFIGFETIDCRLDLLLPVGISFYTFQALSYTLDVYYGRLGGGRKDLLKLALYVSFFPQLVAGPIERSVNLLPQIQNIEKINVWNYDRVRDGLLLMMWGLFEKLVIADRAALLVDTVVYNYQKYGFIEILIAVILFAVQIYCDFGGYTNIAIGAARVMGFTLTNNFRQPYLAGSIKEFWRRWHISLTSWFTDYLYIPLGGNRKGLFRKYINILIVFGMSGLWHGASWNFVAWGLIHAVYQIFGDLKGKVSAKIKLPRSGESFSKRLHQTIVTFVLVDFAWIFFVSPSFMHAIRMIRQMFTCIHTSSPLSIGLDLLNWAVLVAGILILLLVDVLHENGKSIFAMVNKQELWFRWIIYLVLIWSIIMLGIYGMEYDTNAFIYFQF